MENNIIIKFKKEGEQITLGFDQPNLGELIKKILKENLEVSAENVEVESTVQDFDQKEFKSILVSVHEEFVEEINKFYENIETDIKTYYDENLSTEVIRRIKRNS